MFFIEMPCTVIYKPYFFCNRSSVPPTCADVERKAVELNRMKTLSANIWDNFKHPAVIKACQDGKRKASRLSRRR